MSDKTTASIMVAKLPNNRSGRAALAGLRRYVNRDGYRLRVLFCGPRPGGAYATRRADATAFRVYLDRTYLDRMTADNYARLQAQRDEAYAIGRGIAGERDTLRSELVLMRASLDATMAERANTYKALQLETESNERWRAEMWKRVGVLQRQLNAVPPWCLWLAGFIEDCKARGESILARIGEIGA